MAELDVGTPFQEGTRALAADVNDKFGAVESFVNTQVVHSDGSNQGVFGAGLVPTGAIVPFAGGNAPTGWLVCDGQEVSQNEYSALWNIIGASYGVASNPANFRVPDLRGRVVVAVDSGAGRLTAANQLAASGGSATHTLTQAQMPSHTHTSVAAGSHSHGYGRTLYGPTTSPNPRLRRIAAEANSISVDSYTGNTAGAGAHSHSILSTGGGQAHNIVQPFLTLLFLIKT